MPRPLSPPVTCVRLACHMSGTVYGNAADGFKFLKVQHEHCCLLKGYRLTHNSKHEAGYYTVDMPVRL